MTDELKMKPEARGVEGMEQKDCPYCTQAWYQRAAVYRECTCGNRGATPNPVRAEQPEGKGKTVELGRLRVNPSGDFMGVEWNRPVSLTNGQVIYAAAPAAPVGVDEEMVERMAKWLCRSEIPEGTPLEGVIWRMNKWERFKDEARTALTAALAGKDSDHD